MKTLQDWLLYLTNNEKKPAKEWKSDEVHFDIIFFVVLVMNIVLGLGCWIGGVVAQLLGLFHHNPILAEVGKILIEGGWIFVGTIFFIEAWDSIRHNRDD